MEQEANCIENRIISESAQAGFIYVNAWSTPEALAALLDRGYEILAAHGGDLIARLPINLADFRSKANSVLGFARFASWFAHEQPVDWTDMLHDKPKAPSFPSSAKITFR